MELCQLTWFGLVSHPNRHASGERYRLGVGRDNTTLTEPTSSHEKAQETRRVPQACPEPVEGSAARTVRRLFHLDGSQENRKRCPCAIHAQ